MFYQSLLSEKSPYVVEHEGFFDFGLHWHSELEILFCTEGSFQLKICGKSYTVCAGQAVFISSLNEHEYFGCHKNTKVLIIEFGAGFLGDDFKAIAPARFAKPVISVSGTAYEEIFSRLIELREGGTALHGKMLIKSQLYTLAAMVLQDMDREPNDEYAQRSKSLQRVQKAMDYVFEHYGESITVREVAALTGYEVSAFCILFKKMTSTTFHHYLNSYRIGMACVLLNDGRFSVAEVGERVGIPCPKSFSRVFRKFMGITPSQYRR